MQLSVNSAADKRLLPIRRRASTAARSQGSLKVQAPLGYPEMVLALLLLAKAANLARYPYRVQARAHSERTLYTSEGGEFPCPAAT